MVLINSSIDSKSAFDPINISILSILASILVIVPLILSIVLLISSIFLAVLLMIPSTQSKVQSIQRKCLRFYRYLNSTYWKNYRSIDSFDSSIDYNHYLATHPGTVRELSHSKRNWRVKAAHSWAMPSRPPKWAWQVASKQLKRQTNESGTAPLMRMGSNCG